MLQMKTLENLLVEQRQKSSSLEHQLSAAQDRIGGAERKARLLDEENIMIKSELKFWNDVYAQDTGVSHSGKCTSNCEFSSHYNASTCSPCA